MDSLGSDASKATQSVIERGATTTQIKTVSESTMVANEPPQESVGRISQTIPESDAGIPHDTNLADLEARIGKAWKTRLLQQKQVRTLGGHNAATKLQLEQDLATYKTALVRLGRNGGWTSFLRDAGIPKATADRFVQRYERRMQPKPDTNLLTEEISPGQLKKLADRVARQLSKKLCAPHLCDQFLELLRTSLMTPRKEPQSDTSPLTDLSDAAQLPPVEKKAALTSRKGSPPNPATAPAGA